MKYMKLGIYPDTFYTQEATRSVLSDVPSDLIIQINNTRYRLHKCGLLQCLCSDTDDSGETTPIMLHGIPGGEEAFELCAKFCYGITINLSAHNFVPAISAAKYLRMTESISKGNVVMKLEAFFDSCILHGWKDPIVLLQATGKLATLSEKLGLVHRCIEAIVEKILVHPSKVTWSYTYTRPGYIGKPHRSVPKDWWTENVSDLDLNIFRSIISIIRSANEVSPQLIGEALHVYACKHLPDPSDAQPTESSSTQTEEILTKYRRVLESIVSMIPAEFGSVSGRFLLRLLKVANIVRASPSTKAELIRRSGRQLHEAMLSDLFFKSSSNSQCHDIDLVEELLEVFLAQFRQPLLPPEDKEHMLGSLRRVATIIDSYLQVIAHDADTPVSKFVDLAESLPELARPEHDELYKAIDIYLKEHPDISKEEKKKLCRMLDCRKLSVDARSHAIRNDRLPLRTIVQLLFTEQEQRSTGAGSSFKPTQADAAVVQRVTATENHNETPRKTKAEEEGHGEAEPPVTQRVQNFMAGRIRKAKSESKVSKKKEKEVINEVLKSKSMPK